LAELLPDKEQLTISRIDNMELRESLSRGKRHKQGQKRVLEQLRADEGSGTLFISPTKIQKARDLASTREQEKEHEKQDKADRAATTAVEKALRDAEAQRKREAKAITVAENKAKAEQKKAAAQAKREARKAQKELQQATETRIRPRGRP